MHSRQAKPAGCGPYSETHAGRTFPSTKPVYGLRAFAALVLSADNFLIKKYYKRFSSLDQIVKQRIPDT